MAIPLLEVVRLSLAHTFYDQHQLMQAEYPILSRSMTTMNLESR